MDALNNPVIIWLFVLNNIFWMAFVYVCIKIVSIPPEKREIIGIPEKKEPPRKVTPKVDPLMDVADVSLKDVAKSMQN